MTKKDYEAEKLFPSIYIEREDCIKLGHHLVSCDSDGFCITCGEQE